MSRFARRLWNPQVTIPAGFRKAFALSGGAKLIAVRGALVMVPHDGVIEWIFPRFQTALSGSGQDVDDLKAEALRQREAIVTERPTCRSLQPPSRRDPIGS